MAQGTMTGDNHTPLYRKEKFMQSTGIQIHRRGIPKG